MDVELFTFPGSNACLTVELLLDHAGVEWREHRLRPVLHVPAVRRAGFSGRTVPAAIIDGEHVQGSRDIAHAIAARVPQSGLLPADPARREQVLAAERDGERLQNAARRLVYLIGQRDTNAIRPLIDANFGGMPRALRGIVTRGVVIAASKGHGAKGERAMRDVERVATLVAGFDELVEAGVLGTDTPTVADFQIAPNLALLALATNVAPALQARPSWRIAERLVPRYPLDVTATAPDAWVEPLTRHGS